MQPSTFSRRRFIQTASAAAASAAAIARAPGLLAQGRAQEKASGEPLYKISLAQWSLHKAFFDGKLDPMNFAKIAKQELDIDAVEYVNQFYKGKGEDKAFLQDLKSRAEDNGVKSLLIMVDGEGQLGDADDAARKKAVENHHKWVEAAKFLGCHSIRVNAGTKADYDEGMKLAADGLRRLSEFAKPLGINVIVENHGGLSSNGQWLAATIRMTGMDNCGTLPDFGNFRIGNGENYDKYKGVEELMPLAKAVSAKSYDFDEQGNETTIDYPRMIGIVLDHDYHGYVGIEYEGSRLDEMAGIKATRDLLIRCREEAAAKRG